MAPKIFKRLYAEIGVGALVAAPRDIKILCLRRLLRLIAYGGTTLILMLYLSSLNITDTKVGLFMTLTLLGDVGIGLLTTAFADRVGIRTTLALGSLLMSASGVVFALSSNYWVLLVASVLGVISPRYELFNNHLQSD
jgi:MFS family permease